MNLIKIFTLYKSLIERDYADPNSAQIFNPKKDAHENVNEGLMQKVAETVTLEQKLDLARGKNRKAVHKLERHKNLTETAKGYVDGPESQESKLNDPKDPSFRWRKCS